MNEFINQYKGKRKVIVGWNEALAVTNEHVSSQSLVWAESGGTNCNASFGAGVTLVVASNSANDAVAGTGAQKIKVIGAEGGTGNVIEEEISMNGTTSVSSLKKFQLIYAAYVSQFGTGKANAGIIGIVLDDGSVTNTAGVLTTPTPALTIAATENYATGCVFMAEPEQGKTRKLKIKKLIYGVSTQPVVLTILVRCASCSAWFRRKVIPLGNVFGGEICLENEEIMLGAGDVIRVDALSTTAAGRVFVQLEMEIEYGGSK